MAGSAVTAAPCSFFAAGKCRNGATCKFSHAALDSEPRAAIKRRPPCKFFLQNACTAGRECKFSHEIEQNASDGSPALVTTSAGERKPAPGAFGTRCRFYDKGACATGRACPYRHIDGGRNNSDYTGSSGGSRGGGGVRRPPVAYSTMQMPTRKQSDVTAEGTQTEGEGTQQHEEEGGTEGEVAKLSDFLTKEEELYYYGAPGEFDDHAQETQEDAPLEGKPSYADIARQNLSSDEDSQHAFQLEGPGAPPKTCTYYLQGRCRYGDSCFYAHSLESAPTTAEEQALVELEVQESADLECGICYDRIIVKGERFGLLSGCDHAFCLSCVRNWRGTADQPKQTVRQCPVCRTDTYFVIPSNRLIRDPVRKKKLIAEYTKNLANIPCRHFDEGRGTCPFGTSCFYAHRYPTGEEEVRQVRTAVDADGQYDVLRNMRLDHFFQNLEMS